MLAAAVADIVSSSVVSHPDKEVKSLTLTGTRRADAPPDVLFVATAQGAVLRFKLSISAARMGANTAAGARSVAAKKQFKKLLLGAKSGVAALQRAASRKEKEFYEHKPTFADSGKAKKAGAAPAKRVSIDAAAVGTGAPDAGQAAAT